MLVTGCLVAAALVSAPEINLEAGAVTEASAGFTPVQPGDPATESAAVSVVPSLGLRLQAQHATVNLSYAPRIFYRAFFGDTTIAPLDRPLVLHTVGLGYAHRLSRAWRFSSSAGVEVGEVDFQAAGGIIGPATDLDGQNPNVGRRTAQAPRAQAISALTISGAIGLIGQLTRSLTWTNGVSANTIRQIEEDASQQIDPDTGEVVGDDQIGAIPPSTGVNYGSSFAYQINPEHRLTLAGAYGVSFFQGDATLLGDGEGIDAAAANREQVFHTVELQLGYGWAFGRSSSLDLAAGVQLAIGSNTFNLEGTDGEGMDQAVEDDGSVVPVPTGSIGLNWVPVNQRSFTVSNNVSVAVAGVVDPTLGFFQPRLEAACGFQLGFPPRLSVALLGSFSMPLQRVDSDIAFAAGLGAGDSQVEVSVPITYQFSDILTGSIGGRVGYLFTRFGAVSDADAEEQALGQVEDTIIAEGFVSLTFRISTAQERRGIGGAAGPATDDGPDLGQ